MGARMYRKLDESAGNVLGFETRGRLTEEELRAILKETEDAIAEHGKIRLLVYMPEVPRPELAALDDDLKFAREHLGDLERYAIVGDNVLLEWAARLEDPLLSVEIRHFDISEYEEAWRWLREPGSGD